MFDRKYWYEWWIQLQHDTGDFLQNNILNASSFILILKIYVNRHHPEFNEVMDGVVNAFLGLSGGGITLKTLSNKG